MYHINHSFSDFSKEVQPGNVVETSYTKSFITYSYIGVRGCNYTTLTNDQFCTCQKLNRIILCQNLLLYRHRSVHSSGSAIFFTAGGFHRKKINEWWHQQKSTAGCGAVVRSSPSKQKFVSLILLKSKRVMLSISRTASRHVNVLTADGVIVSWRFPAKCQLCFNGNADVIKQHCDFYTIIRHLLHLNC